MGQDARPSADRPSFAWLWYLTAAGVLVVGAVSLVRPMTTYKLLALDAGGFTVGWIGAVFALVPLVCVFYFGARAQRAPSLKPLLIAGASTVALGSAAVALAHTIAVIALGMAVVGMGQLVFAIAGQAAIARFTRSNQLDMAFGWFTAGFSAGQMFGPLIGGMLLDKAGDDDAAREAIDLSLWISALSAGVVLVLLLIAGRAFRASGRPPVEETAAEIREVAAAGAADPKEPVQKPALLQILRIRRMKSHMFASIALVSMVEMLVTFLPLIGEAAGVSPFWVGLFLSIRAAASILSRAALPLMRRAASRDLLVLLALWVSGTSLALLPMVIHHIPLSIAMMVVAGFFLGVGQPLTMSLVTRSVPLDWRSPALAVRMMGNRVGSVTVPLAAGAIAGLWGPAAAIWLACFLLLSSGTEQLVLRRKSN